MLLMSLGSDVRTPTEKQPVMLVTHLVANLELKSLQMLSSLI